MADTPTNVYDVTQPPDTQQANLLGLDLRNFRLDVQQRMAFQSDVTANMWNPGSDAQPTNWTGLLFFATDTGHIWRWSGTAWVDVTSSFIPTTGPPIVVATVELFSQNAAIGYTTFYTTPSSGVYRMSAIVLPIAGGTSPGNVGAINAFQGHNNGISGVQGQVVSVNSVSFVNSDAGGTAEFFSGSGQAIQYAVSMTGGYSINPTYDLFVKLEFLGA